jgi:MoaA/NifB/PqqE/SkfB family radical SAM enzyme
MEKVLSTQRQPKRSLALTTVVPAPSGCNLKCPGCVIDQKSPDNNILLTEDEYVKFFRRALTIPEVTAFSIQGHEPLLPAAWPLSKRLLQLAVDADKKVSLVSNGTYLERFAEEVMKVSQTIIISVDSHDGARHDILRGHIGAWNETIAGIKAVRARFGNVRAFRKYLAVASILRPGRTRDLAGMPELLKSLGVGTWLVTPLVSIKREGYADQDYGRIRDQLIELDSIAKQRRIKMVLSDEFYKLGDVKDLYSRLTTDALTKGEMVSRLEPDGSYSVGDDILKKVPTTQWNLKEDAAHFVRRVHDLH